MDYQAKGKPSSTYKTAAPILIIVIILLACKENTFQTYYDDGIEYYKDCKYEEAIVQFKKSIELNIDNEKIYPRLVSVYKEANLLDEGINYFEKLISTSPENGYLQYGLGLLLLNKKEVDSAIVKLKAAIQILPTFAAPYSMLNEAYYEIDKIEIAEQYFSKLIELEPEQPYGYYGLAYAYRKQYDQDQAFENIETALILKSDEKAFIYLKVKLYSDTGEYEKSLAIADSGLKILAKDDYDFRNTFLIHKSTNYWYMGENKKALELLNEILNTSTRTGNIDHELRTLNLMGLVYRSTDRPRDALDTYFKAMEIAHKRGFNDDEGIFLGNVGDIYLTLAENDSALVYLLTSQEKLEEINDIKNLAATYSSIAIAYSTQAEYEQAFNYGEKAIKICQEVGDPYGEVIELINFSVIHVELGNYFKALEFINQALLLSRESGQKYNEQICLANIGEIYYKLGDYSEAKKCLELSNKVASDIDSKGEIATNNATLGTIHLAIGDTSTALQYLENALKIFIEIPDKSNEATTYTNIAIILTGQRHFEQAKDYFTKALQINQEIGNRIGESYTLIEYGNLCLMKNEFVKAYELYLQALNIGNSYKIKEVIAQANFGAGRTLKGQSKFEEAVEYFQDAIVAIEKIRGPLRLEEYKSSFFEEKIDAYHELIDLYYKLYRKSGKQEMIEQSFNFAERSKSRALLDILAESKINIHQGIDSLLLKRQKKNQRTISDLLTRLTTTELSDEQEDVLYSKINQSEEEFSDLQFEIQQKNPAYADLNYPEPISVKDIQKMLPSEKDGLIEYSLGGNNSYLWVITKDNIYIYQLAGEKEIIENVNNYLSIIGVSPRTGVSPDKAGKALYDLLLSAANKQLNQLENIIIIPDGILHYLPFEALVTRTDDNLPIYFVESFNINYSPSASVYKFIKDKKPERLATEKNNLIAFADPVYGKSVETVKKNSSTKKDLETVRQIYKQRGFNFSRLRYSTDEVMGIANHFTEQNITVFLREEAKEEKVKSGMLIQYNTIHFATHALIDEKLPGASCIVLTIDEDPTEDGFLRMDEIFNMKLDADLVTLSACQTARGKLLRGEGIMGLARAFFYAGASSLVVSHWQVSDYSTAQFMEKFYGYMQNENSKSEALRKAKMDFINSKIPKYRHPYYWAAFVLTGVN